MKSSLRIVLVVAVATLAIGAFVAPAGAGKFAGNMVTINKTVVGTAPAGTVFTVQLDCSNDDILTDEGFEPIEVTFAANGAPTSENEFEVPPSITCTATETGTGGANTVAYACAASGTRATCPDGATDPTLQFVDVVGSSGVITVTNTFVAVPTPPITPAPAVVVAPTFTG